MVFETILAQDDKYASKKDTDQKIETLTKEIEKLKKGKGLYTPLEDSGVNGMGPAASKVYYVNSGVSIAGYGEMLYENYTFNQSGTAAAKADKLDFLRQVLYFGYKFSDNFYFNSEIEIEHASEIYLEFAYIDYKIADWLSLRAGLILAPVGFVNELHEPPIYLGAKRPFTERYLIPTTWREIGLGLYGKYGGFTYRLYGMGSFNGENFTASDGVRGGRQKAIKSIAENFGIAARIDYTGLKGFLIGISGFYGNTGQDNNYDAPLLIGDIHSEFKFKGLQLRGLFAYVYNPGAADINLNHKDSSDAPDPFIGNESVGSHMIGWYVEAGYDVLNLFKVKPQLILYGRFEMVNTQFRVPNGYSSDGANDDIYITAGISFKPIPNISLKVDYQWNINQAGTGVDQLNASLGYMF